MDEIFRDPNFIMFLSDTFESLPVNRQCLRLFGSTAKAIAEFKESSFYNEDENDNCR